MSDRSERLFAALTQISDRHIEEAAQPPEKQAHPWRKWGTAAACVTLIAVTASIFPHLGGCGASMGDSAAPEAEEGYTEFLSYAGPILPLTLETPNDALTAERTVTLDFAPWVPRWEEEGDLSIFPEGGRWRWEEDLLVEDSYLLTNTGTTPQTVTVQLPFVSSLEGLQVDAPMLEAEGQSLSTELLAGKPAPAYDYTDWQDCADQLSDGTVRQKAATPLLADQHVPVTVYAFTEPWAEKQDAKRVPNPTVQVRFDLDFEKTQVLTYGFDGGSNNWEEGRMCREFSIPDGRRPREPEARLLLIFGEPVRNLETSCHSTGGSDPDTPILEEAGVTVTRHDANLMNVLWWLLEDWDWQWPLGEDLDADTLYRLLLQQLDMDFSRGPEEINRRGGMLEDSLMQLHSAQRVLWTTAQLTIPAGETLTLTAHSRKEPSYNYGGTGDTARKGYDLLPWLDTSLTFTGQTAVLNTRDRVEPVDQNFGFDPAGGVNAVSLSPEVEHYYLEVVPLPWEEP